MGTFDAFGKRRVSDPELAVFVSGVASMGLEILAGRMVAPQFGSSIYTWGSVIGVFLAALSLGYYRGGRRAAERATGRQLTWLLLATAAYVAGLILAGEILLAQLSTFPLPPRFASLPAITVLFGPPTYLLGFISPYAAELSDREGIGEASGRVYALGTVGSIVGAFGTTFVLIPSLSVDQISLVFGLVLVLTAARIALSSPARKPAFAVVAVTLLLAGAILAPSLGYSVRGEIVYETQTPYQELRVVDRGDTRTLYLDGTPHSAMDKDDPTRHVFEYTRYFHLPFLLTDDPDEIDRVLFIGGGGFTGPKRFVEEYDVTVDVAEIDPAVIDAAERYFGVVEGEQLNVHNVGGRQFLRETNRTYDLIVLDAYKRDKVPFQLTTVEFMRLTRERLADDGVLFANLISAPTGPASQFYRAEYRTMAEAYPQVYSFPTAGSGVIQNVELVATKNGERVSQSELRERNRERDIGINLSDAVDDYAAPPDTGDVPVLRDDDAPVDALLEPMAGQRYVVEEADPADGDGPAEPNASANRTGRPGETAADAPA
ncbi:spermidine synthase [Halostella sp. JP-L12]|uniref:spermidine synthase n=1 Tax=Halostella TaxID=1843185 RepID=UPI000EF7E0CC|nr:MULTISPECIES: fused MFS/spermidine synthase [Halostella]NHN46647.1 spermidine synthase [Halostella sp. JP-L12]